METGRLLRFAISERRIVTFTLHGLFRRAEPHDYGIIGGVPKLFFYQVGGRSRSGPPIGWRWALVDEIAELTVLQTRFRGTREAPTGRHVKWDILLATVSPRVSC